MIVDALGDYFCVEEFVYIETLVPFHPDAYSAACTEQIKVSNSALISAFMTELEADTPVTQVTCDLSLKLFNF